MAIYDYLPTYHQVEVNTLKGLHPGFVVSQMNVASAAKASLLTTDGRHMENGKICGISKDGIVAAGTDTKVLFIHYSEPLPTFLKAYKYYAVDVNEECPRLVQLVPGDEWMSDMEPSTVCISGRIVEIASDCEQFNQDDFYHCDELADGTKAHHYMFIG